MKEHSEPSKEERKRLLIEMMKEDEKNGMYEVPTKTDNELIAEFMGYERSREPWDQGEYAYTMKLNPVWNKWMVPSNMRFATSWDWLMPVVEKIESSCHVQINGKSCHITNADVYFGGRKDSKIESVYSASIEFIKWYNNQKK